MPTDPQRKDDAQEDAPSGEDLPIPPASEDEVLDGGEVVPGWKLPLRELFG